MADFSKLLDAVMTALNVINTAGNMPGANLIPYVSTIASAAGFLQLAISKGRNVAADIAAFRDTFANGLPSQDKLDALDARIAAARTKLHLPLPSPEEGEPD